ncbi:MAG: FeoA family protein [Myxococcota bacterium]
MKGSLAEVPVGAEAEVTAIGCDRGVSRRLMEMGLLPGTEVRVVRVAPLGDPIELRVRDYSLSVRRADASKIAVTRGPG